MKARPHTRIAVSCGLLLGVNVFCSAQWITGGGGAQYLTNPSNGVRVGTAIGVPPSALTVQGDQMTPQTGETFRTISPGGTANNWRMFRGGTEISRFYSNLNMAPNAHFFQDAPNGDLRLQTSTATRLRINRPLTSITTNGYTGLDHTGHVGIGTFSGSPVDLPVSLLHLDRNGSQLTGFRPWMRGGLLMTENSDQMYVGPVANSVNGDRIDAVISWSDNNETNPTYGPDVLRFIFTKQPNANSTANSLEGLEVARIRPATNGN